MKIHKIAALATISVLMSLFLVSVLDEKSADNAFADFAPTATPRSRIPVVATPIRIFLPFIANNAPSTINCITLTAGLTPVGTHCSDPTIGLNFTAANSTNGITTTVARGDHIHTGQQWIGSSPIGLSVETTVVNGYALTGYTSASSSSGVGVFGYSFSDGGNGVYGRQGAGSGITPPAPAAIWGDSANNWGVLGTSNNYAGVVGISNSSDGIRGATSSSNAFGVSGTAPITGVIGVATNAGGSGVYGRVNSTGGNGVYGYSADWNGVRGSSNTGSGVAASSISGAGLYATSTSGFAIQVDGDAKQTGNKGGLVKAMAYLSPTLSSLVVANCYNSQVGAPNSTAPCGMTPSRLGTGTYTVDLGFDVTNRFFSATPALYQNAISIVVFGVSGNTAYFKVFLNQTLYDVPFYLIVY